MQGLGRRVQSLGYRFLGLGFKVLGVGWTGMIAAIKLGTSVRTPKS